MSSRLEDQFMMYCTVCGRLDDECMKCWINSSDKCKANPVASIMHFDRDDRYTMVTSLSNMVVGNKDETKFFDEHVNLSVSDLNKKQRDDLAAKILLRELDVSGS